MYHVPLRASAAIASGVVLVSLFGAASPALAKGGHVAPPAPVAFECIDPATTAITTPDVAVTPTAAPVATPDTPVATPDTPVATPDVPATTPDVPAITPDVPATTPDVPATTPDVAVNYVGDAGCVAVLVTAGTVRLAWVVTAQGWTYEVERNGGGTNDRVELRFTQASTNATVDFRYEFGKTSIG
jgi:hypothetical protein